MIIANTSFLSRLLERIGGPGIDPSLRSLLDQGMMVENDCVFLASIRSRNRHVDLSDFQDRTGLECFINAIHIDDYTDLDAYEQAVWFITELMTILRRATSAPITIIASWTETGMNVRFHVQRVGEDWIVPTDIDSFEETVLMLRYG